LSVGVGLGVLAELLEEEVVEVVGVKGKHDPGRMAVRPRRGVSNLYIIHADGSGRRLLVRGGFDGDWRPR
jgi:hypothetical protein